MKRVTRYTVLFAALLGVYGMVHADTTLNVNNNLTVNNDPSFNFTNNSTTTVSDDLSVDVSVAFDRTVSTDEGAVAVTNDTQKLIMTIPSSGGGNQGGGDHEDDDPHSATVNGSVSNNVGNTGANFASGAFNQQANDTAIAVNTNKFSEDEIAAAANAGFEQMADYAVFQSFDNSTAMLWGSVNYNAGNTGVNAAAGFGNQQKNDLALAVQANDPDNPVEVLDAHTGGAQLMLGTGLWIDNTSNWAQMHDSVTNNLGNTGVNVAAGALNQQGNALAVATADSTELSKAVAGGMQVNAGSTYFITAVNNATDVCNAVNWNIGNTGVNVASGYGNQQANNLSIAAPQH